MGMEDSKWVSLWPFVSLFISYAKNVQQPYPSSSAKILPILLYLSWADVIALFRKVAHQNEYHYRRPPMTWNIVTDQVSRVTRNPINASFHDLGSDPGPPSHIYKLAIIQYSCCEMSKHRYDYNTLGLNALIVSFINIIYIYI